LSDVTYKSLLGTSVPRDFVEVPSQIMDNWAAESDVVKMYAKHYKTSETIPDAYIQKLEKSSTFGQGFATVKHLTGSLLDMNFHSQTAAISLDIKAF
jgi:peptidyl-dipeptidase Dcp